MSNKFDFFKPEDFDVKPYWTALPLDGDLAATLANEKLNALIKSWPTVYGKKANNFSASAAQLIDDDFKARLAFIEPIVKEPCKHEPEMRVITNSNNLVDINAISTMIYGAKKCRHCGVELQATWSAK